MNILDVLANERRWWSTGEITNAVDADRVDVARELHRLADTNEISSMRVGDRRMLWGHRTPRSDDTR
jgi:hypothetical protein